MKVIAFFNENYYFLKCQMPNAKCQMPNAKCQMPNAKCLYLLKFWWDE
jgi:hypothetical protein